MHSDKRQLYRFLEVAILAIGLAALPAQTLSADSAPTKDTPPDLRLAINRTIGRDQDAYHFKESGAGCFKARYAALGADVLVGQKGLTVRTGAGAWTLGASAPTASDNMPASGLTRQTAPNRVEVDRGWATEWVVNGPAGLEQGWDIPKRPSWVAEGDALLIPLEQDDNLRAMAAEADGRAICVRDAQGRDILRYAGLNVTDATGRELPARFETRPDDGALWIKVTDTGASYPITIDPWVQSAKLVASDKQQTDHLGCSVALSADGQICAVGAYGSSPGGTDQAGAVYIFTNAVGSWAGVSNQAAKLVASDRQAGDYLGCSVALSAHGDICAAGAYISSPGGTNQAGAVYIFTNAAGSWAGVSNETTKLFASDRQAFDNLGFSVALSSNGGICAAGTPKAAPGGTNQAGAVYIFTNVAGSWAGVSNQAAKLFASDRQWNDSLGRSVALSADGGICAAGAYRSNPGGTNQAGAVYIFTNAAGSWAGVSNQAAKLFASDRRESDYLGYSVALSANGDICAAGTPNSSPSGTNMAGAVYIFTNAAGSWTGVSNQATKLFVSDRQAFDSLGNAVALSADGGICAAGAFWSSPGSVGAAGAVYIFTNAAGSWAGVSTESAKLFASDGQEFDNFGSSVALSADGGICAAGAFWSSPGGTIQAGAAYVNVLSPPGDGWLWVAILPGDVVAAGAQWRVDDGPWQTSGAMTGLTAGEHTVNYSAVTYYDAPVDQVVTISPNQLTAVQSAYTYHDPLGTNFFVGPICADYDGDKKADPALFAAIPYYYESAILTLQAMCYSTKNYAIEGDIIGLISSNYIPADYTPIAADFDGDGKPDIGFYQAAAGKWSAMLSTADYTTHDMTSLLGNIFYTGLAADFDGDRKADPAVYNPVTAEWKINFSAANYKTFTLPNLLGGPGFAAAAADMDGDGLADPYVCNMMTGKCKVLSSRSFYAPFTTEEGFLGAPGCILALADYDGDGFADPAVYFPSGNSQDIRVTALLSSTFYKPTTFYYFMQH